MPAPCRPVLALLSLALALPAQAVEGVVRGFDGAPAARAVVRLFDEAGRRCNEVLTDDEGRFAGAATAPLATLEVQLEGVQLVVPVPDGADENLEISFADARHFTLKGHLVDPAGAAMVGIDVLLRDDRDRTVAVVTTGAKGAFTVRVDRAVGSLLVDPLGLRHVQHGDYDSERGIAIDLRLCRDEFFRVDGRVLDAAGAPIAGAVVRGSSAETPLVRRTAGADGAFVLWSRERLDYVMALDGGEPVALCFGRLERDSRVDLDVRRHGYARLRGRVVDAAGEPAPYVAVYAADAEGRVVVGLPALARADVDGGFAAMVPVSVPFVLAWQTKPQALGMTQPAFDAEVSITVR